MLIVGYSFGDAHINKVLKRHTDWHGDARRIALIDYADRGNWSDLIFRKRITCTDFLQKCTNELYPLDETRFPDPFVGGEYVRAYFKGFTTSVAEHDQDIIAFLQGNGNRTC